MADISNKTLMGLMAVALVLIIASTIYSFNSLNQLNNSGLTGHATEGTGDVNVTITGTTAITVTGDLSLGTGAVNSSEDSAWVSSESGTSFESKWVSATPPSGDMFVANTGSTIIKIDAVASKTAQAWLCPTTACTTTPVVGVTSIDKTGETGSCRVGASLKSDVTFMGATTTPSVELCSELLPTAATDELEINFNATIPIDAASGLHTVTITFTGTQIV